jgi:beta-glucosidase
MNISETIAKMTLEEKASLCSGMNFWETKPVERLDVPSIMMTDGPHGLRKQSGETDHLGMAVSTPSTCFPPASLNACSFDRDLLREMGEAIGAEAVAENVRIVLGPGVNIKRSPLCGRNFEYFSEDPYLAGELAAAFIKGVESKGVGTSIKHFAANNQETRRFSSDSRVDERTLNEIYFPAFEHAVKDAKPSTVMCSYNLVNGVYASENRYLLTETLRDKWGFDGFVVSDWGAVNRRVLGLIAGLDLEMPGVNSVNDKRIVSAVQNGDLSVETLDMAVERILRVLERVKGDGTCPQFDREKHNSLARRIAAESMVLLKNEGLLPLDKNTKIAFIGEFAASPRYQGAGSSQVNPTKITGALEAAAAYTQVTYSKGYDTNMCEEADAALQSEAVAAAKEADVCVIFAGLPPAYESEGFDREHMRMPGGQNSLIEAVAAANPNIVVVLHNGSPVEMPWADKAGAILEAYLGGQAGGGAVADILFGAQNPCGKLNESFPLKLSDNPSYLSYFGEGDVAEYREGIFVGYRYYDAKEADVRFPFGHGLSYTTFAYSNLRLSADSIDDTETLTVKVDVTNTGRVAGKETVQLYVGAKDADDRLIRAPKELKGFEKLLLQPGETKTAEFTLNKRSFAYYNTQIHDWHVATGTYRIQAGSSSRELLAQADVTVYSTEAIPFKADVNTPIRDIMRMEGGEAFMKTLMAHSPIDMSIQPEPGSLGYMFLKMLPDMVMRQLMMMGGPDMTLESCQAMLDAGVNNAGELPEKGADAIK